MDVGEGVGCVVFCGNCLLLSVVVVVAAAVVVIVVVVVVVVVCEKGRCLSLIESVPKGFNGIKVGQVVNASMVLIDKGLCHILLVVLLQLVIKVINVILIGEFKSRNCPPIALLGLGAT